MALTMRVGEGVVETNEIAEDRTEILGDSITVADVDATCGGGARGGDGGGGAGLNGGGKFE